MAIRARCARRFGSFLIHWNKINLLLEGVGWIDILRVASGQFTSILPLTVSNLSITTKNRMKVGKGRECRISSVLQVCLTRCRRLCHLPIPATMRAKRRFRVESISESEYWHWGCPEAVAWWEWLLQTRVELKRMCAIDRWDYTFVSISVETTQAFHGIIESLWQTDVDERGDELHRVERTCLAMRQAVSVSLRTS